MLNHRLLPRIRQQNLEITTVRDFSGGWNTIDSELTLQARYARLFRNVRRMKDATVQVRYGSKLFAGIQNMGGGDILNQQYFSGFIVVVDENGFVFLVTSDGTVTRVFDPDIAAAQPGAPNGWSSSLEYASFTRFRGDLTIHNGIDKPLIVSSFGEVSYLRDLATGTNFNTPIGRYATAVGDFLLIAGDPVYEDMVHISNQGTSGTWFGDAQPNNAVQVRLSGYVASGSSEIRGIVNFRDKVLVCFDETIVVGTLGTFNSSGGHVPDFSDTIEQFGTVSHHAIQNIGDDVLFADTAGIGSVNRSVLNETLRPNKLSYLIDPEIQKSFRKLTQQTQIDHIFSVYDRLEGDYMLWVPTSNLPFQAELHRGFIYTSVPKLKINSWSEYTGRRYHSACRTAEGRIMVSEGSNIFQLGNDVEPVYGDLVGYAETFSDNTQFTDGTGFTPATVNSRGLLIDWEWELPWADFDNRRKTKETVYFNIESEGTATFSVSMFVDRLYEAAPGIGEPFRDGEFFTDQSGFLPKPPDLTPVLTSEFIGGDEPGLGYGQLGFGPLGLVRSTSDERLYHWPARFNIAKFRFNGMSNEKLRITSFTLCWRMLSVRR